MSSLGPKRVLACLLATPLLLWLALPGGGELWPLLFLAPAPLLLLAEETRPKKRFLYGFLAGLLHFLLQIYWIVIVLGRYGGLPWFISVPALVLLCCYMAFYTGLFLLACGAVRRRWGRAAALWAAPLLWVGLDWLRSVAFSGFPWLDLGYGLWQAPLLIQAADLLGHHVLTFAVLLGAGLAAALLPGGGRRPGVLHFAAALLLLAALPVYGVLRTAAVEERLSAAPHTVFGVVQGNIDQGLKWSPEQRRRTVEEYLAKSDELSRREPRPEVIVWPETALPFYPQRSSLTTALQHFTRNRQVALLTGSPWFERSPANGAEEVRFYNAAFLIDLQGQLGSRYYKSHLVPFGEYVPLRKLLFFLAPLVEAVGDFSPGKVEMPLATGQVRAGVLICFESIFPAIARQWSLAGANVLVNLTNDAWYGRSSAPRQSWAMSVLRAVETRKSLVRAANTGISGFVDPLGRITSSSPIFTLWADTAEVALLEGTSFHSRLGYLFGPLCALVGLGLSLAAARRQRY